MTHLVEVLCEGYVDYNEVMKKISNNDNIINMSIELGAQSPRQCDIGNQMYWEKLSDIPNLKRPKMK